MRTNSEFSFEVLVTTMNQKDLSKYKEMNLQTNAIIANQSDVCDYTEEKIDSSLVKMITTNTRGVSINRNIAIIYSNADYIMFADDDQIFVDGYLDIIKSELQKAPKADAIKFYCESTNIKRPLSYQRCERNSKVKKKRVIMSAGVHALLVKRQFLVESNLFFDINVGPGCEIYCGEDSVFLSQLFDKKAKIYESPKLISYVKQEASTWFKGYTDKHFVSVGYIYAKIYGKMAIFVAIRRALKSRQRIKGYSVMQLLKFMKKGIKDYRNFTNRKGNFK